MSNQYILLSFDVEEFDLPLEYNQQITLQQQLTIGNLGVKAILPLLNNAFIKTTLFTTATYAIHYPEVIKELAKQHEIASHTYYHSSFKNEDLQLSKQKLEEISLQTVTGLRMPRMHPVEMTQVAKAGYTYDSSINPTIIPGRYNNTHLPRTMYVEEGINRIPASVSPNVRIPLFWLAFKNFPYQLFKTLAIQTLKKDGYLCLYFHPWEFTDAIKAYQLPAYITRDAGDKLLQKLNKLMKDLLLEGDFIGMNDWMKLKIAEL